MFEVVPLPAFRDTHVAYYGAGSLFCGDTLFACGCGKVFEGTSGANIHFVTEARGAAR